MPLSGYALHFAALDEEAVMGSGNGWMAFADAQREAADAFGAEVERQYPEATESVWADSGLLYEVFNEEADRLGPLLRGLHTNRTDERCAELGRAVLAIADRYLQSLIDHKAEDLAWREIDSLEDA